MQDGDSHTGGSSRFAPSVPSHRILRHPLPRITCLRRAPPSSHGRGGPCPREGVPIRRRCSVPGMRLWFCVALKLLIISKMLKSPTSFWRRRFQEVTQGQLLTCHVWEWRRCHGKWSRPLHFWRRCYGKWRRCDFEWGTCANGARRMAFCGAGMGCKNAPAPKVDTPAPIRQKACAISGYTCTK